MADDINRAFSVAITSSVRIVKLDGLSWSVEHRVVSQKSGKVSWVRRGYYSDIKHAATSLLGRNIELLLEDEGAYEDVRTLLKAFDKATAIVENALKPAARKIARAAQET